ncbi:MAG: hypothetical protein ACK5NC_11655 [Vibrio sp.]
MGKITELEQWDEEVYALETTDPVLGGDNDAPLNRAAANLANRTAWLKEQQSKNVDAHKRQILFMPHFCAAGGWEPDPDLYAPELGQKCYKTDYPTVYEIVSTLITNVIDEDTKSAGIASGDKTYAAYFGIGSDENGEFFTTRNKSLFMHDKAAGEYGSVGEFKDDHMQKITGSYQTRRYSNSLGEVTSETWSTSGVMTTSYIDSAATQTVDVSNYTSTQQLNIAIDSSRVTRTHELNFTDSMGAFSNAVIGLPKGEFKYA